jgi:hypothetical protein
MTGTIMNAYGKFYITVRNTGSSEDASFQIRARAYSEDEVVFTPVPGNEGVIDFLRMGTTMKLNWTEPKTDALQSDDVSVSYMVVWTKQAESELDLLTSCSMRRLWRE